MADTFTAGTRRDIAMERQLTDDLLADIALVAGDVLNLTGSVNHEVTDTPAADGMKVIGVATRAAALDTRVSARIIGFRRFSAAAGAGGVTRGQACVRATTGLPIAFLDHTTYRASRASINLAGLVTTQGDLRAAIAATNVDTTLPVGTDPVQAALMIVDAINKDATVGLLVYAWHGVAAAADGGVARGNIGLAGTVTTGGDLRGTVAGTNIDVTLAIGDTPFEAAEMWCNAFNVHADLGDDFLAWVTSADADALLGATAFGSVVIATDATGGATLTITLDGTAVQIVPAGAEFPDSATQRMVDALNDTAALTDRFAFTWDSETPGTGGSAAVRIWARHPGSVYNMTLVAASTDATMTAVASGATLTGGADITEATIHIRALKPGAAYNVALASSAEAGLVGLVPTASGAALTEGSDDAAATVFLEARYVGVEGDAITLTVSQEGGLVGMVPTASAATFTDGASGHRPENIWCIALSTAIAGATAEFIEL